jgi:hypothetical protein
VNYRWCEDPDSCNQVLKVQYRKAGDSIPRKVRSHYEKAKEIQDAKSNREKLRQRLDKAKFIG